MIVKDSISKLLKKLLEFSFVRYVYQKAGPYLPAKFMFRLRNLYFTKQKDYSYYTIRKPSNKKHNLLLIQPPISIRNHLHKKIFPMGLLYISAYLKKHFDDVNIELLDMQPLDLPMDIARAKIMEKKWDVIGFSFFTAQADEAYTLSEFARRHQRAIVVHGGVHPMLLPEEALNHADIVVCHEGEETLAELMAKLRNGQDFYGIKGIAYKRNGHVVRNETRPFIKDLDSLPFPDWDLLEHMERYDWPMHIVGGPRMPILGSRGCPFNCTFCSSPMIWKRRLRWRQPEQVALEMKTLKDRYGFKSVHFWDDNLMMKPRFMETLCHQIMALGLEMHWVGLTRASHIVKHRQLLPLMKEAGCLGIEIGVESFSDVVAEQMEKGEEISAMEQATEYMERAGIVPLYTHMLFNPGETINSYRQKHQFLTRIGKRLLHSDAELGQLATPHRTTVFEQEAPQIGKVYCTKNKHYIHHRVNFIPYSFLEDVPVKQAVRSKRQVRKKAEEFLYGVIYTYIMDWEQEDGPLFLKVAHEFWQRIDGTRNVGELADRMGAKLHLDPEASSILTSLAAVCFGREGWIFSRAERTKSN
jgi:radical SAM superfamily enzyme YgiQ (UPF0313 family)